MNNSLLSNIKTRKYLGIILDSKMSWIQHIAYVKNKVTKGIGIMFTLSLRNYFFGLTEFKYVILNYVLVIFLSLSYYFR